MKLFKLSSTILGIAVIVLCLGQGCDAFNESADTAGEAGSTGSLGCPRAPSSLQNPKDFSDAVNLVNSLPKPLSLICFLANLEGPLEVFSVNSGFSAQPAPGKGSPRIFIFKDSFMLSVVPAGAGRDKLEFGKVLSSNRSVKGEIEFPVLKNISQDEPFTSILTPDGTATSCQFCHLPERRYAGNSFESELVVPDGFSRVDDTYMRDQALNCNLETDRYRCGMIKTIFLDGEARDVNWPY